MEPPETERLHFAEQERDEAEARRLLTAGESVNRFDDLGETPHHYAAEAEKLDIARPC